MRDIYRNTALVLLAVLILTTAACSAGGAGEPTSNPDLVYTAAAQTVQAQLTDAANQNSAQDAGIAATSAVQTFQAQLTSTAAAATPTTESFQVPTISLQTQQGSTPGQPVVTFTPIVLATMTFTPPPPSNDTYEIVGQEPADNTVFSTGGTAFDMIWFVKNTGTTTWTKQYTIEFFLGDRIGGTGEARRYYFHDEVKPGETIDLYVDMTVPTTEGTYYSWWKLKNEYGANFADLDVTLIVDFDADDD